MTPASRPVVPPSASVPSRSGGGVDLSAVRARHVPRKVQTGSKTHGGPPEYGEWCRDCDRPFPCDATRLLTEVDRLTVENERLRDVLQSRRCSCPPSSSAVDPEVTG
jgi:hypothetical protein